MKNSLFYNLKTASKITDTVLVGFSGGKDSAVVLDLCYKYFKNVQPFFMFIVKGLEFQEKTLRYYEDRYNTEIIRVPHFMLAEFYKFGTFRQFDETVPLIKTVELYNYLRDKTGIYWIAGGERIADSIIRRAMIKNSGSIDEKRGRFYPIAEWKKADVMEYVDMYKLPLSTEHKHLGFSFRSLEPAEMYQIKQLYPEDFERIKKVFPLVEASVKRYEFYGVIR